MPFKCAKHLFIDEGPVVISLCGPSTDIFPTFLAITASIDLRIYTSTYINELQIMFEFGFSCPIFERIMDLKLSKFQRSDVFLDFFVSSPVPIGIF